MNEGVRFYAHGERVTRAADGRTGTVKDVAGLEVNIIWDGADIRDPASREWVPLAELEPAEPG